MSTCGDPIAPAERITSPEVWQSQAGDQAAGLNYQVRVSQSRP
jgi:hypothetical protein